MPIGLIPTLKKKVTWKYTIQTALKKCRFGCFPQLALFPLLF